MSICLGVKSKSGIRIIIPVILPFILIFSSCNPSENQDVFSTDNLLAWCIVPFDAANRGSMERAEMLKELGITKLAYDWRDEHIPGFDLEYKALKENSIRLQSFWLVTGSDPSNNSGVKAVFDFLERNKVETEIWLLVQEPEGFPDLDQNEKVEVMAAPVKYVADRAAKIGCKVALYNHGNWFGEPENQLAIIEQLNRDNIGMVFNFHHAGHYIERFSEFYPKMQPHLYAINLAGLKLGSPGKFYGLGEGDAEQEMIRIIKNSEYNGPIGIINHDNNRDAKLGLETEMAGLKKLLQELD